MIVASCEDIETFTRAGWWGRETLFDLVERRARVSPDAEALVDPANRMALLGDDPQRLTYRRLLERVLGFAAELERIGIGRDEVIIAQLPNMHELVVLLLAASRIGAIVSPLALQYRSNEMSWVVAQTRAKAFLTVTSCRGFEHAAYARANLPQEVKVYTVGDQAPPGVRRFAGEGDPVASQRASANDLVTICWTSGTEGWPKGVPRSHNQWLAIAYAKARPDPNEVFLCAFPLVSMASIGGQLVPWLHSGGKFVLHHPFDLERYLEQIRAERVTYTSAPPAILFRLLGAEALLERADLSSLRSIGSGSAPLVPAMLEMFQNRFGIEIINNFGSNEGCVIVATREEIADPRLRATHFPAASRRRRGAGYCGAVLETRLVNPESKADIESPGVPGELYIRGPTVFDGYWNAGKIDRSPFDEAGYFPTGDLLELVESAQGELLYRFVGRSKEIIMRGGMKISPAELEEHLAALAQIKEAACVGIADPVLGERIAAVVVLRPGQSVTLASVVAFLKERGLATYKLPERLFTAESLPRNSNNKVIRSELKRLVEIQ